MATQQMWDALGFAFKVSHILSVCQYDFSAKLRTISFSKISKSILIRLYLKFAFFAFNFLLCCLNCVLPVLFGLEFSNIKAYAINLVLLALVSLSILPAWNVISSPTDTIVLLNNLQPLQNTIEEFLGVRFESVMMKHKSKKKVTFLEIFMKIYVFLIVIILPVMAFIGVIFDIDPLNNFIYICQIPLPQGTEFLMFLIRIFAFFFLSVEIVRVMSVYIIAALIMLLTLNTLSRSIVGLLYNGYATGKLILSRYKVTKCFLIYRRVQLYIKVSEPMFYDQIPVLLFSGSALVVLCNYGTIKMYESLGDLYYCAPVLSSITIILFNTLLPEANNIYEGGRMFKAGLGINSSTLYDKKLVKSLRVYKLTVGPFIDMTKEIRSLILDAQFQITTDCVLSFDE